jgi:4-hydroxy-4-methyl-2-oxoglutarate aldolase
MAALKIRRDFARPPSAALAAFDGCMSGFLADAQGRLGALHHSIRPLTTATRFVGPALTVYAGPRDNLAPYAALRFAKPGDVLVIATEAYEGAAVVGDNYIGMARNLGIVACVTDGLGRDVPGLDEVGIPVFARGVTPNSPWKNGPGTVGLRVSIGGVSVDPGDIVFGDGDGVIAVPLASLDAFLPALETVKAREKEMEAKVKGGLGAPGWIEETFAEKGVDWLE